jgi:hypothetical protein
VARRVPALLERLESPTASIERLVRDAEAHIAALDPRPDLLDAAPFGGLAGYEPSLPSSDETPVRSRPTPVIELPQRARSGRAPSRAAGGSSMAPRGAETALPGIAGGRTASAVVLPISPRRSVARAIPNEAGRGGASTATAIDAGRASPAGVSERRTGRAGGGPADAPVTKEMIERIARERIAGAQPGVTLGQIAQRALDAIAREKRRERPTSARRGAAAHDSSGQADPKPANADRGPTLRPVLRASATGAPPPAAPTGSAYARSGTEEERLDARASGRPHGMDASSAPRPRAAPAFHFDPLEERRPARESDDDLAERIGQVLREQARRQGVDLT